MQRFTLQLGWRPPPLPPWIPHLHKCTLCGLEFECDLPGVCHGYIKQRPHGNCFDETYRAIYRGVDFGFSSSTGVVIGVGRSGRIITSGHAWDPLFWLRASAQARAESVWRPAQKSELTDLRTMMEAVKRYGTVEPEPVVWVSAADRLKPFAINHHMPSRPVGDPRRLRQSKKRRPC